MASMMLLILGLLLATALVAQAGAGSAAEAPREEGKAAQFQAEPVRTGKERLGGKASDEQRVDDCKVPVDLRGPKPRSDDCGDGAGTRLQR